MLRVRFAGQEDKAAWDRYVQNCPDSTAYSFFAWKEAIEQAYEHKGCYLLAEEHGTIRGVFPLILFRVPLRGTTLIALPYCDIGEPLADSDKIRNQLLREAIALMQSWQVDSLEIRSSVKGLFASLPESHVQVQTGKVRMVLELPESSERLWTGFKSKLRSQIRKADKNGLKFRWGTLADVPLFYKVFSRNMHDLCSPVHSEQWIREIIGRYRENVRMGLVFRKTEPVGCGILLCTKKLVSIPWASTLREYNRFSPNMLLYWKFLQFSADNGKSCFDFGRSTPNEGTYRFKKQWGAEPHPLYWYCLSKKALTLQNGRKSFLSRQTAESIWSMIPRPFATYLGGKIRKFIAL